MKPSLREVLANSNIAAVAIAVLLLWSLRWGFLAFRGPLSRAAIFLINAVAIFDIPYFTFALTSAERMIWISEGFYLFGAIFSLAAAWLLSRWVYGVGPLRSLSSYRERFTKGNSV